MLERLKRTFKPDSCYKAFFLSLLCTGIGYGLYKGVLDNYLAEIIALGEFERGVTEFFREISGLLLVFVLAVFYTFSAETIYKAGAVIMLIGLSLQAVIPASPVLAVMAISIYSLGEHIQLGMKNTLSLEYAKEGRGGLALGYQNATYQAGNLIGYFVVIIAFIFISGFMAFKAFFAISAALIAVGMLAAFAIKGHSVTDKTRSRFYFRKKYTKYYMLEVFYGARKQVFFTFGPYVLILFYKADTSVISLLFAIAAISCFVMAPVVGKIIDKVGYRVVMISDTLILVVVCFFYGFAHHIFPMKTAFVICCINYCLDAVISLASMASNVYVQDISDDVQEVRATISTGISVNHLITILIALFGGYIWKVMGIETLFTISAVLGLCNSAYAATIKTKKKA